jgi:hypothetical protein
MTQLSAQALDQLRDRIHRAADNCLYLARIIENWFVSRGEKVMRKTSVATHRADRRTEPGDLVVVLAPSGVHLLAQIQDDGTALAFGIEPLCYKASTGGEFCLIDAADGDADLDTEAFINVPISQYRDAEVVHKFLDQDVDAQWMHVTALEGRCDPEILMDAYHLQAQKWQKQKDTALHLASQLERLDPDCYEAVAQQSREVQALPNPAERLDSMAQILTRLYEDEVPQSQLAQSLRERADKLDSMAKALTSKEMRWSLIKSYVRPQASQWAELLANDQVLQVGKVRALARNQFKVAIHLRPDANRATYDPVVLYLRSREPMAASKVPTEEFDQFSGMRLSTSDNALHSSESFIEAQLDRGHFNVQAYQSDVGADLFRQLMAMSKLKPAPSPR